MQRRAIRGRTCGQQYLGQSVLEGGCDIQTLCFAKRLQSRDQSFAERIGLTERQRVAAGDREFELDARARFQRTESFAELLS